MRAASLFVVLLVAKAAALAGHHLALSWWAPIAYLWQDALVALLYAAVDACLGRRGRAAWSLYAALAFYSVLNIPVVRAVSTPLTAAMWRAARGPLADSIWIYATWENALLCVAATACACIAPMAFRRLSRSTIVPPLAACVLLGPVAAARVDMLGLERNAWTALAASLMPRIRNADHEDSLLRASSCSSSLRGLSCGTDWRALGFDRAAAEDLSRDLPAAPAAGHNIVLVSLESTAAAYLGIYGATPDVMPNLSELARAAIVFENAYAVYPESIKGLYSILCSAYPSFDSPAEIYAAVPCQSLPAALAGAGYATALFHSGRFMYLAMEAVVRNRGYQTLEDAGDIVGLRTSSFGVDEPSTIARLLAWIDGVPAGRPFFVTYLPVAGHHPYEAAEGGAFPESDDFGRYRNALHAGDAALGALMRGLEARGRQQNTLWIVLGDHGEAFGQHEGNYGHTFHLYEENVRVPLLVAAPGLFPQQRRSRRVVSLIDTAPTVLELAGVRQPSGHQGASVLHGDPRMALFFADYSLGMLGLRDGSTKFIYELDSGRARMFDLEKDPGERQNVAGEHMERARYYEKLLRGWAAAQKYRLRLTAERAEQ
jgi:sulfatase-like protein